jgi:ubiquinone/menaquinone biosynthesis C-methylase UbiE
MTYILKSETESKRLSDQFNMECYQNKELIENIEFLAGEKVLDAGCGSGDLCILLSKIKQNLNVFGCDINDLSLEYAKNNGPKSIQYFSHNFLETPLNEKFDKIFNRFVIHHFKTEDVIKITSNFYDALSANGQLIIIDADSPLINIGTDHSELKQMLAMIQQKFYGELDIIKRVPRILEKVGFQQVSYQIDVIDFQGPLRELEYEQWKQRIQNSFQFYIEVFGSKKMAKDFKYLYLQEITDSNIPVFFNQFTIKANK